MKTFDISIVTADPVISEVRRAKTAVAQQYGFDVVAMVRALRQIDEEENANNKGCSGGEERASDCTHG